MHLPVPAPPIRGPLLWLVSRLTSVGFLRDLVLLKVRADAGIPKMPFPDALPAARVEGKP